MILVQHNEPESLKTLLIKDEMYKTLGNCSSEDQIQFDFNTQDWYLMIDPDKEAILGLVIITPFVGLVRCYHVGIYKEFRYLNSIELIKESIKILTHENSIKFIMPVKDTNTAAIKGCHKLGLKLKTSISNGYTNANMLLFGE